MSATINYVFRVVTAGCLWGVALTSTGLSMQVAFAADDGDKHALVGSKAPDFNLKDQDGKSVALQERSGKGWTIVYFYPMADSPGCTEQACAFRNVIERIRGKGAEVYGVSTSDSAKVKAFHDKNRLNFSLLIDAGGSVASRYQVLTPLIGIAKRHTFIIDPTLTVRHVELDVDPAFDGEWTMETLAELQAGK